MYLIVSFPCVLYSFRGLHSNYNNIIIIIILDTPLKIFDFSKVFLDVIIEHL